MFVKVWIFKFFKLVVIVVVGVVWIYVLILLVEDYVYRWDFEVVEEYGVIVVGVYECEIGVFKM